MTIVNIYASNIGAPKYIKQILTDIKEETDSNTVTVGDFKTPLISSRPKLNQETLALNDEREKEKEREYSKQSISKFKKTEVISSIFSNHNAMRLEINYNEKHKHIDTKLYASKQPMDH